MRDGLWFRGADLERRGSDGGSCVWFHGVALGQRIGDDLGQQVVRKSAKSGFEQRSGVAV